MSKPFYSEVPLVEPADVPPFGYSDVPPLAPDGETVAPVKKRAARKRATKKATARKPGGVPATHSGDSAGDNERGPAADKEN